VKAPERILGLAIRDLKEAPSKEWIKGFDAGYASAIKVIQKLSDVQEKAMRDTKAVRHKMAELQKTLVYVEDTIGEFRNPMMNKSILADDLGG